MRSVLWIAAAVLVVLACIPVWSTDTPALVDYPMHIARAHVLAQPQDGQGLTEFYRANWIPIPNLGMDIFASTLARVLPIGLVSKLTLSLIVALLVGGTVALSFALHGRLTWPGLLLAGFVAYDQWFLMGFANYLLGVGAGLFAVAAWVGRRERGLPVRPWAVGLAVAGLAVVHLMGLLLSVLAVLAYESGRRWGPQRAAWGWLLGGLTGGGAVVGAAGLLGRGLWAQDTRLDAWAGSFGAIGVSYLGPWQLAAWAGFAVLLVAFGLRRVHPVALPVLAALTAVVVAGPSFFLGTAFTSERVTLVLGAWLLASLAPVEGARPWQMWTLSLVLGVGLAWSLFTAWTFLPIGIQWKMNPWPLVRQSLAGLPARSTVVTLRVGPRERFAWERTWLHAVDWATLDRPLFVPQMFLKPRQQPMAFPPEFLPFKEWQGNDPIAESPERSLDRLAAEARALQDDLNERYRATGRAPGRLYALVWGQLEVEPRGTATANGGWGWTLLEVVAR